MNEWRLKVDNDVQIEVQKKDIIAEDYTRGKARSKSFKFSSFRAHITVEDPAKSWKGSLRESHCSSRKG